MKMRIKIVSDGQWATGELARAIMRANPAYRFQHVDRIGDIDRSHADLVHLMIWTLWRVDYDDGFLLSLHHLDHVHSGYDIDRARDVIGRASHVVCPCEETVRFARSELGISANKLSVVPYGVDVRRYRPRKSTRVEFGVPEDAFVIGHFSSLHPRKGFEVLLDAFEKLVREDPSFFLLALFGRRDGDSHEVTRRVLGRRVAGRDRILMLPYAHVSGANHRRWPRLFGSLDVYCSPAFLEGGPLPLLQAMASGVPVVATRTGMAPEIHDGTNLVLTEAGDPDELARSILEARRESRSLSVLGLETVRKLYDEDRYGVGYGQIYDEFASRKVNGS